jgi:hypothetical protein
MMRIVVLTSLSTAMVRSLAVGPYSGKESGENALFRNRHAHAKGNCIGTNGNWGAAKGNWNTTIPIR